MEEVCQEHTAHNQETEKQDHRHHHSHRRRRSRSKFRKFVTKHKKSLLSVLAIIVGFAAVFALGFYADRHILSGGTQATKPSATNVTTPTANSATLQIEISHFSDPKLLISNSAHAFVNRDMSAPLLEVIDRYKDKDVRLDIGLPVTISYHIQGIPNNLQIVSVTVEVAESLDFADSRFFTSNHAEREIQVYYLKTGTQYYYRVGVTLSDQTVTYAIGSFQTEPSPRILGIEGVVNVRDVGGWKTTDGKTVRQGLLYRGSELDGAVNPAFKLTSDGQGTMLTILGIRTEMDLRSPDENMLGTHALGANVKHIYYAVGGYTDIFDPAGKEAVRRVFSDLANPDHYPVYMHCTYGADRTGTMCYLLALLLGVSEEDALRDYELSALYYSWADSDAMNALISTLQELPGDNMQQKVEGYMLSIGLTEVEIEQLRGIFLQ